MSEHDYPNLPGNDTHKRLLDDMSYGSMYGYAIARGMSANFPSTLEFEDAVLVDVMNRAMAIAFEKSIAGLIRCRDCRFVYLEDGAIKRHWCDRKERRKQHSFVCHPQGFFAWGEPRENPCRNADENAAAFADAPTLETAREPKQTPVFELGA